MKRPARPGSLPALALVAALCMLPAAAMPAPRAYWIDPVHTRVVLLVGHAGFSRSIATASGAEGELHFDAGDWSTASVVVRLPAERIDFGDHDWNRRMAGRHFFESARHPYIEFRSTRVEPLGGDRALVHGELVVAGTRGQVVLDARFNDEGRNPANFRPTIGFSATATLDRRDFGLIAYPNLIGNEVELLIEVEAVRGRRPPARRTSATQAADAPADEGEEEEEER